MHREPLTHRTSAPRLRGLALTGAALALLTMVCLQLGSMNLAAWRTVRESGPASPDQALTALAGSLALALIAWLLGAMLLSLLAALGSGSSAMGRAVANSARLLAPVVLRNSVAALLGVAIAASPAVADAASHPADTLGQFRPPARSAQPLKLDPSLSPAWVPTSAVPTRSVPHGAVATSADATKTDRRRTAVPSPTNTSGPETHSTAIDPSLLPGWIPGRPTAPPQLKNKVADPAPVAASGRRAQVDPDDEIVVRRGDTLWDIAGRHLGAGATDGEIALEWPYWFSTNRAVIGSDPDHLVPGERLRVPEPDRPSAGASARTGPAAGAPAGAKGGTAR